MTNVIGGILLSNKFLIFMVSYYWLTSRVCIRVSSELGVDLLNGAQLFQLA